MSLAEGKRNIFPSKEKRARKLQAAGAGQAGALRSGREGEAGRHEAVPAAAQPRGEQAAGGGSAVPIVAGSSERVGKTQQAGAAGAGGHCRSRGPCSRGAGVSRTRELGISPCHGTWRDGAKPAAWQGGSVGSTPGGCSRGSWATPWLWRQSRPRRHLVPRLSASSIGRRNRQPLARRSKPGSLPANAGALPHRRRARQALRDAACCLASKLRDDTHPAAGAAHPGGRGSSGAASSQRWRSSPAERGPGPVEAAAGTYWAKRCRERTMNLKMYSRALKVRMSGSQGSPWLACSTYWVSTAISFLQDGDAGGRGSAGFPASAKQPSGQPLSCAALPAGRPPSPGPGAAAAARYALVGERGAEVLADVRLQDGVEVLELPVGHQPHDENLREGAAGTARGGQRDAQGQLGARSHSHSGTGPSRRLPWPPEPPRARPACRGGQTPERRPAQNKPSSHRTLHSRFARSWHHHQPRVSHQSHPDPPLVPSPRLESC